MKRAFLTKFIGVILVGFIFWGVAVPGYSMYVGNTSGRSFDEDETGTASGTTSKTSSTSETVEDLVIKAASYFLKGKAHAYLLSSKLEAAAHDGVCYYEYQMIVNDALNNMRMARYYYQALKDKAEITPYNQEVITQLKAFDYNSFSKDYSLNSYIFNQVKGYLEAGDVRGVYARFLADTDSIINVLETVQINVYYWQFPKTATIWELNQACANMLLFGQYVARVFYAIP